MSSKGHRSRELGLERAGKKNFGHVCTRAFRWYHTYCRDVRHAKHKKGDSLGVFTAVYSYRLDATQIRFIPTMLVSWSVH